MRLNPAVGLWEPAQNTTGLFHSVRELGYVPTDSHLGWELLGGCGTAGQSRLNGPRQVLRQRSGIWQKQNIVEVPHACQDPGIVISPVSWEGQMVLFFSWFQSSPSSLLRPPHSCLLRGLALTKADGCFADDLRKLESICNSERGWGLGSLLMYKEGVF